MYSNTYSKLSYSQCIFIRLYYSHVDVFINSIKYLHV